MRKLMTLALLCMLALAASACGGDDTESTQVSVTLKEWEIESSASQAPSGTVVFAVRNDGSMPHQLIVIKNDLPPDMLPVSGGSIAMSQVKVLESIDPIGPGATGTVRFETTPGKYVLVCNLPGHYQQGMAAAFLVDP